MRKDRSPLAKGEAARKKRSPLDRNGWSSFRFAVLGLGIVIALSALFEIGAGTLGLPEHNADLKNATLEANYRFLAAQLFAVGMGFVAIAIRFEWANMLWFVCGAIFVGGLSQVYSIVASGAPHFLMVVLMVVELAAPPAVLVWYQWIAKTESMKKALVQGE